MDLKSNFILFRQKIKETIGFKRLGYTLLGSLIFTVILLTIEYGLIGASEYFQLLEKDFMNNKLLYLFIGNILISYIFYTSYFYYSMHSMMSVRFDRDSIDLLKFIKKAKSQIDLSGLSLKPFAREDILKVFESKVKKGVTIRILLLNPFTVASSIRPKDLYAGEATLSSETIESLINLINFAKKLEMNNKENYPKFEVKLYSDWPTVSMFRTDNHMNFSVYLQSNTGLQSPYFICDDTNSEENIFNSLKLNFEKIWESSISIKNKDWLLQLKNEASEQKENHPNSLLSLQINMLDEIVM